MKYLGLDDTSHFHLKYQQKTKTKGLIKKTDNILIYGILAASVWKFIILFSDFACVPVRFVKMARPGPDAELFSRALPVTATGDEPPRRPRLRGGRRARLRGASPAPGPRGGAASSGPGRSASSEKATRSRRRLLRWLREGGAVGRGGGRRAPRVPLQAPEGRRGPARLGYLGHTALAPPLANAARAPFPRPRTCCLGASGFPRAGTPTVTEPCERGGLGRVGGRRPPRRPGPPPKPPAARHPAWAGPWASGQPRRRRRRRGARSRPPGRGPAGRLGRCTSCTASSASTAHTPPRGCDRRGGRGAGTPPRPPHGAWARPGGASP